MRLWFRQSLRNTLWLYAHAGSRDEGRLRVWWRLSIGRCTYCGRKDCID